jgi:hypothetical protein
VRYLRGSGQQPIGLAGDRFAGLARQRPDLLDLGAEPVVLLAQLPLRLGRAQLIHVIAH